MPAPHSDSVGLKCKPPRCVAQFRQGDLSSIVKRRTRDRNVHAIFDIIEVMSYFRSRGPVFLHIT